MTTTTTTKAPATKAKPAVKIAAEKEVLITPLEKLKSQADLMDIEYRDDITENALRKLLMSTLAQADKGETITNTDRKDLIKQSTKLVRCIVSPNSPQQKEYPGQLFSIGNSVVGYISKFVQFNAEYHIPQIIYDHIKAQQMQYFVNKKEGKNTVRVSKLRPAYTVDKLPDLTKEELAELAASQLARGSIED